MTNKLIPMPDKGWAWIALSPFALWAIYLWVSLPAVGVSQ